MNCGRAAGTQAPHRSRRFARQAAASVQQARRRRRGWPPAPPHRLGPGSNVPVSTCDPRVGRPSCDRGTQGQSRCLIRTSGSRRDSLLEHPTASGHRPDQTERFEGHRETSRDGDPSSIRSRSAPPGKASPTSVVDYLVLNYDTVVEEALTIERIALSDGIAGGVTGWWNPETFDRPDLSARVLRLHGSVDWYEVADDPLPRRIGQRLQIQAMQNRRILIWPASMKYREVHPGATSPDP